MSINPRSTPAWEQSKENAAPLSRGRNVAVLEQSLLAANQHSTKSDDNHHLPPNEERDRMIQYYERLVSPSEQAAVVLASQRGDHGHVDNHLFPNDNNDDDDPLIHWLSYIKYYQDHVPSDTHTQFLLMERCTRALVHIPRYANDVRFIRVCVTYADKTTAPSDVFTYLYQQHVGRQVTLFWMAWAWVAEHAGNYAFCEKVYKRGMKHQAQPAEQLKQRYNQFIRRMSRKWLNQQQQDAQGMNALDEEDNHDDDNGDERGRSLRGALGSLKEDHVRRNDRTQTAASTATSSATFIDRRQAMAGRERERPANNGAASSTTSLAFPIYVESNDNENCVLDQSSMLSSGSSSLIGSTHRHHRVLEREADRKKENTQKPEPWNHRPGGYTSIYPAAVPTIASHSVASASAPPPAIYSTAHVAPLARSRPIFDIHVDEVCVAQEQRNEQAKQELMEQRRRARDERTFRERADGGMAEKLSSDPLRYVKNPSKFDTDQAEEQQYHQRHVGSSEWDLQHRGAAVRQQQRKPAPVLPAQLSQVLQSYACFEEARASTKAYRLASATSNFNLLSQALIMNSSSYREDHSGMDIDEEESLSFAEDVVMKDVNHDAAGAAVANSSAARRPPPHDGASSLRRANKSHLATKQRVVLPKRVLFSANSSFDSQNTKNVSTASSSINERDAVGNNDGGAVGEETTINTKYAVKELSVMFASPAYLGIKDHCQDSNDMDRTNNNEQLYGPSPNTTANTEDEDGRNEVPGSQSYDNDESRTASFAEIASLLRNDIDENAGAGTNVSVAMAMEPDKKENGGPSNPNPRSIATPGFETMALQTLEGQRDDRLMPSTCASGTATDRVVVTNIQADPFRGHVAELSLDPGFSIYCDEVQTDERKPPSKSTLPRNEIKRPLSRATAITSSSGVATTSKPSFQIYQDDVSIASQKPQPAAGDRGLEVCDSAFVQTKKGTFSIWVGTDDKADDETGDVSLPMELVVTDGEAFGDISRIAPATPTAVLPFTIDREQPIRDYTTIHNRYIEQSLESIKLKGKEKRPPSTKHDLLSMLSTPGLICHLQNQSLPRGLQSKILTKGTEIRLGNRSGIVKAELGRGGYGTVVLLGMDVDTHIDLGAAVAVKIQTPTGSLALEYEVLQKIEIRVSSKLPHYETLPFPRPLSLLSMADGGLMSMTAASTSGMNLVDLSNVYRVQERSSLPELIALHYTARMLKHMEVLHKHGEILHCDAKPDNWVMVSSATAYPSCRESVPASDLMLVDFGHSIDLSSGSNSESGRSHKIHPTSDSVNVVLWGNAAGDEEMACPAMRRGLEWCYDVDMFGICSSAHVLLFSSHIHVVQDYSTKRWKLSSPLRRYWQRDLWHNVFDTLLNFEMRESSSGVYDSSIVLHGLRISIETYLQTHKKDLDAMLKKQARLLPSKRLE